MVGLGRMGGNMAERLRRAGHTVVGYDSNSEQRDVESCRNSSTGWPRRGRSG